MNRQLHIRNMLISDYEEVYALWASASGVGLRTVDDSREGIEAFLKRNPDTCFVAEWEGVLAGVILSGNDGRRGYLYHLAVREEQRGKGIGSALLEAALGALASQGIRKASLVVFTDNALGNRFWENKGFSVRDDLLYRDRVIER